MIRLMTAVCLAGLMAAAGLAQHEDVRLLAVETLPPEPTVIVSGDLVKVTYRVRFPDLADQGKEIIILEDRMKPDTLTVHPFEAVGLEIDKRRVRDGYIWDLVYALRLIQPVKASVIIPPIAIYWLVRDFGEAIEDADVQQVETEPAAARYVTTITDGPVDIRDTIDLGSYGSVAAVWTAVAWLVAPLPLLFWAFYVAKLSLRPKPVNLRDRAAEELARIEAQYPVPPAVRAARRQLRRTIRGLRELGPSEDGQRLLAVERDLLISTRDYLRAELPELNPGDTARDIRRHVDTHIPPGGRKDALAALASRLVAYQHRLEQGSPSTILDPADEARALEESLDQLRSHVQIWRQVTRGFKRQ